MKSPLRWLVLGILSSALLLIVIDMTVIYLALPSLTYELRATANENCGSSTPTLHRCRPAAGHGSAG